MATKKAKTKINLSNLFKLIEKMVREGTPVETGLARITKACAASGASVEVHALAKLPIAAELKRVELWFESLWSPKPPPARAKALYFGIAEFEDGTYDYRCAALPGNSFDTEDWLFERGTSPKPEYAKSEVLAALSQKKNGPVSDAEARHVICLGYVALIAAHLCRTFVRLLAPRAPIVAAGYDEGDFVVLGRLHSRGVFEPPPPEPEPKPATLRGEGHLFELAELRKGGAWLLNSPRGAGGRNVELDFTLTGRRVKPERYETSVYKEGRAVDISFTIGHVLIVRRNIADILEKTAGASIQRLRVTIEDVKEPFEIINILRRIPPKKLLGWSKQNRRPVSEAPLGKSRIARTGKIDTVVVVDRHLAEALAAARITGAQLMPLDKSKLT